MDKRLSNIRGKELSSEMKLLLLCSINDPPEKEYREIQELTLSQLDWKCFYELTMKHRIYPVVYKNLRMIQSANIRNNLLSTLEQSYNNNRVRSMLYTTELVRLMELFKEHGIRAVSIKGPILSFMIYGDISMRTSRDLDILVSPADLEMAEDVLLSEGYVRDGEVDSLTVRQRACLVKTNHDFVYENRKKGIVIELHWRFYYESYNFRFEEIWEHKSEAIINGKKINVLGEEDNLLYLIFHGSKHAWKRLKWLCDVYEIIKKDDLDWIDISDRAKKLGITHVFGQALILSNLLFKTELHRELFSNEAFKAAARLAALSLPFFLSSDENAERPGHPLYLMQKKYLLAWNSNISMKLAYVKLHFYPIEMDFKELKIKDKYFAVYFLTRPLLKLKRMLKTGGKRD